MLGVVAVGAPFAARRATTDYGGSRPCGWGRSRGSGRGLRPAARARASRSPPSPPMHRVDLAEIGHVVAVRRAGRGGEDRRGVEMADAERRRNRRRAPPPRRASCSRGTAGDRSPSAGSSRLRPLLRGAPPRARGTAAGPAGPRCRRRAFVRQFGCSSMVPGTLTCSTAPVRSSAGTAKRRRGRARDEPMQRDGERLRQLGRRVGLAPHHRLQLGGQQPVVVRAGRAGAGARALGRRAVLRRPSRVEHADLAAHRRCRDRVHQPASVCRSCVVMQASASRG